MSTNPRQTVNQRTLLGVQSAADTPVLATKLLPFSQITFAPQAEFSQTRANGKRIHTASNPIKEWTQVTAAGPIGYNELAYYLAAMFDYAAPTGTNEKTWTFESDMDCADANKLYSAYHGDECVRGDFVHDLEVQSGSLTFARNGVSKSFTLYGKELEHGVSQISLEITGSPTGGTFTITYEEDTTTNLDFDSTAAEIEAALAALDDLESDEVECLGGPLPGTDVDILIKKLDPVAAADFTTTDTLSGGSDPESAISGVTESLVTDYELLPGHVSVYFADTQAGLDAAGAAVRNLAVTFNYNNKKAPLFVLNATHGNSYKEGVETPADIGVSFDVAADSEGEAFLETMRDGDIKFMRVEAVGAVIGTDMGGTSTASYTFSGDFAFMINAAPSLDDMEGLYKNTYGGVIVEDSTWGKGYSISLINSLSAL
jgi:hypothetical protein